MFVEELAQRRAMDGHEVLRILAEQRSDEIVLTTMSTLKEWPHFSRREELDLPVWNCMGKASSLGLGLALARPDRRIWVFDGDGSLLMNLGSLATIAGMAPKNLVHFVFENAVYETTGGQPIPNAQRVDFAGLALEAGYPNAYEFDDPDELRRALPDIAREDGPILVSLKIRPGWAVHPFPARKTREALPALRAALGQAAGGR